MPVTEDTHRLTPQLPDSEALSNKLCIADPLSLGLSDGEALEAVEEGKDGADDVLGDGGDMNTRRGSKDERVVGRQGLDARWVKREV